MNKKAYFFSITVLIVVAGIYLTMIYSSSSGLERENVIQEERIKQLNSIITAFEKDSPDALKITSTRSLIALTEEVSNNLFTDETELQNSFEELTIYGTLNGNTNDYMENSTLLNWTGSITKILEDYNSDVNFVIANVMLSQINATTIQVSMILNYTVEDSRYGLKWNKTNKEFNTLIQVQGLKDPLYTHYTDGNYENIINITQPPILSSDLIDHATNQNYVVSSNAPSYLQRFIENVPIDEYSLGIESLINTPLKEQAGFTIKDVSIVDWQYFITEPSTYCSDASLPTWIKINSTDDYPISC